MDLHVAAYNAVALLLLASAARGGPRVHALKTLRELRRRHGEDEALLVVQHFRTRLSFCLRLWPEEASEEAWPEEASEDQGRGQRRSTDFERRRRGGGGGALAGSGVCGGRQPT